MLTQMMGLPCRLRSDGHLLVEHHIPGMTGLRGADGSMWPSAAVKGFVSVRIESSIYFSIYVDGSYRHIQC